MADELLRVAAGSSSQLFSGDPDWSTLLAAADFHGLKPLLHQSLANADGIPAAIAAELLQAYQDSAKRGFVLTAWLAEITERFDAAEIPVIALKGPSLAESLYDDSALRPSYDLDLLVQPSDVEPTLALMARVGYSLPPHLLRFPALTLQSFDAEVVLEHPRAVAVELHWAVAPADYPFAFDPDVLWRSARSTTLVGRSISTLSPECLLLYLSVHGAKHAWARLFWLGDVARLVRHAIDWDTAVDLSNTTGCRRPLLLALLLAHDLLEADVPLPLLDNARADAAVVAAARDVDARVRRMPPAEPTSIERTAFNARLAESAWAKARHWTAMLTTPKDEDLRRWRLPAALFWVYRPLRMLRLIGKYAGRVFSSK